MVKTIETPTRWGAVKIDSDDEKVKRKTISIAIGLFVSLITCVLAICVMEIVFQIFPPTGIYHSGYQFDQDLGNRFRPNSTIIYNKAHGFVKHTTNRYGWVDVDHDERKTTSLFRVGFLGDSYVEGLSVSSEKHFFRNLPTQISGMPIEYFGFGRSGFGTVHSYLNSRKLVDRYDLDLVVYVFVENDLGDNISWIKKKPNIPYAAKSNSEPGFFIEKEFVPHLCLNQHFFKI